MVDGEEVGGDEGELASKDQLGESEGAAEG